MDLDENSLPTQQYRARVSQRDPSGGGGYVCVLWNADDLTTEVSARS